MVYCSESLVPMLCLFYFNLGFALLQIGSSSLALSTEGGFGTPQLLKNQLWVSHSSP